MHRGRPEAHRSGKQLQVKGEQEPHLDYPQEQPLPFLLSPPGRLARQQLTLTPLGATLSFRSSCAGGGKCTESSL